jgi:hypothetical protein
MMMMNKFLGNDFEINILNILNTHTHDYLVQSKHL